MGEVKVHSTESSASEFRLLYYTPTTDSSWFCAGANIRREGDDIYLDFVDGHAADDGFSVHLPTKNTDYEGVQMVSFRRNNIPQFRLFIDGREQIKSSTGLPIKD